MRSRSATSRSSRSRSNRRLSRGGLQSVLARHCGVGIPPGLPTPSAFSHPAPVAPRAHQYRGWPDHLVVGSRSDRKPHLPHPTTKHGAISGDSLQTAALRTNLSSSSRKQAVLVTAAPSLNRHAFPEAVQEWHSEFIRSYRLSTKRKPCPPRVATFALPCDSPEWPSFAELAEGVFPSCWTQRFG